MGKAAVLADVSRVAMHVARERITRPRPTVLTEIPPAPTDLTEEWLTAALCNGHPNAEVVQFYLGRRNEGSTSRRAIVIDYNEAGREAGLPTRLVVKNSATFVSPLATGLPGAAAAEAGFYSELRPLLTIECPVGYYTDHDRASLRAILLMEDVAATKEVTWIDVEGTPIDRARAESMVGNMAAYHGAMWANPRLQGREWLPTAEAFQINANEVIDFEARSMVGVKRAEGFAPVEFLDRRREIFPSLMRSLAMHADGPQTLLHQDVHPLNWYVTPRGEMGLFDWNCTAVGHWAVDFAYAMAAVLEVEDRRAWEEELLRLYLERLDEAGGAAPDFDEAWLA